MRQSQHIFADIISLFSFAWSFLKCFVTKKDCKPQFYEKFRALVMEIRHEQWSIPKIQKILYDLKRALFLRLRYPLKILKRLQDREL